MIRSLRLLPLATVLGASAAYAVFPNQAANPGTDEDLTYTSVVRVGGESGVAIDPRWILTAQHVAAPASITVGATVYNVIENYEPPVVGTRRPDLRLLKVDADLPAFTKIDTRAPIGLTVDLVGYGISGVETTFGYDFPGRAQDVAGIRRRATNRIEGLTEIYFDPNSNNPPSAQYPEFTTLYYDLTAPGGPGRTTKEGGIADKDSGGGFFHDFGDGIRLVATNSAIGTFNDNESPFVFGQGVGFGVYLGAPESVAFLNAYVPQAVVPEPATFVALGVGAFAFLRRRRK